MAGAYPLRQSHHAHRLTRLSFKSCAALAIGHHAVCLITHIAHTEDAARYQGPVRFWNSQLMETLGFSSPKQLTTARSKAIEFGWLAYDRTNDRSVGHYWTLIPPHVARFDDHPVESDTCSDSHSSSGMHSPDGKEKHSPGGTQSGMHCGTTTRADCQVDG
jgi:hypothetical protein